MGTWYLFEYMFVLGSFGTPKEGAAGEKKRKKKKGAAPMDGPGGLLGPEPIALATERPREVLPGRS